MIYDRWTRDGCSGREPTTPSCSGCLFGLGGLGLFWPPEKDYQMSQFFVDKWNTTDDPIDRNEFREVDTYTRASVDMLMHCSVRTRP